MHPYAKKLSSRGVASKPLMNYISYLEIPLRAQRISPHARAYSLVSCRAGYACTCLVREAGVAGNLPCSICSSQISASEAVL